MSNDEKSYDKRIYPRQTLENAVFAYKGIANIRINEERDSYKCVFGKSSIDTKTVINEFDNYLIELLNS